MKKSKQEKKSTTVQTEEIQFGPLSEPSFDLDKTTKHILKEAKKMERPLAEQVNTVMAQLPHDSLSIEAGLAALARIQETVSSIRDTSPTNPITFSMDPAGDPPSPQVVATFSFALMAEVVELATEMQFKPWKPRKEFLPQQIADEFADVLAFLGVITHIAKRCGVSSNMIATAYARKTRINISRFTDQVKEYQFAADVYGVSVADIKAEMSEMTTQAFMDFVPSSDHNPALKELLEIGSRSDGPFTDESVMNNPRISTRTIQLTKEYQGHSRFVLAMGNVLMGGGSLSAAQVRAVANILYTEATTIEGHGNTSNGHENTVKSGKASTSSAHK